MDRNRTAFRLAVFTVAYNLAEGGLSICFSIRDGSIALFGFGADSFIESLSGAVMLWRFWNPRAESRERRAARLVGITFLILAAYIVFESLTTLAGRDRPDASLRALLIAAASLVVMPVLFWQKRRTAQDIGSKSLLADAKQTLACLMLSTALLIGAGLNYWLAWWQADAVAALVIAGFLMREGYEAISDREAYQC